MERPHPGRGVTCGGTVATGHRERRPLGAESGGGLGGDGRRERRQRSGRGLAQVGAAAIESKEVWWPCRDLAEPT
jgi:hypothetical protein